MKKRFELYILALIILLSQISVQSQIIHHDIKTEINISKKQIDVIDSITFPITYLKSKNDTLYFNLNADFTVKSLNNIFNISEINSGDTDTTHSVRVKRYMITYLKEIKQNFTIPLHYKGNVFGEITTGAAEIARGFSQTSGIISQEGIYLSNSTAWVPLFNEDFFTFNLTTVIDSAWGVISQGTRTKNEIFENKKVIRYEFPNPADEVYLIAAKWKEYSKKVENILVQVVLRTPDAELAEKYIDATANYLILYNKLIGAYPYTKFTLIENFWETGYGMPSFTLLGSQIIRFPFILTSSYPHELLHNYWGNSVYVNTNKGNWCEGLTSYMADHLIKEQISQGNEYRRTILQKYTDFVNESNDFPISQFLSRNNSAEESIGYGKTAMIFEMLRYKFGDDLFKKALSNFYQDFKFKKASFDDIQKSFEDVTGKDLKSFFDQWILRKGAPSLQLSNVDVKTESKQFKLTFALSQVQKEDVFNLVIPIAIYFEGDENVVIKDVELNSRIEEKLFLFDKKPVRIDVDPQFNVFRRLDKAEVPVSISQMLGAKESVIVLPKNSPYLKEYSELAEQWKQTQNVQGNKMDIVFDTELPEMPNFPAWLIGFENKFVSNIDVFSSYSSLLPRETISQIEELKKSGGLVYVFKNSKNESITNGFLGSNNQKMIEALKRKVTHYSKYSYIGFEGENAQNKLKGEFPILNSPLIHYIKYEGKTIPSLGSNKQRKALIY